MSEYTINGTKTAPEDTVQYTSHSGSTHEAKVKHLFEKNGKHHAHLQVNLPDGSRHVDDVPFSPNSTPHSWQHIAPSQQQAAKERFSSSTAADSDTTTATQTPNTTTQTPDIEA